MDQSGALPSHIEELRALASEVSRTVVRQHAADVDERARWPVESIRALGDAGLLGLHVGADLGGRGEGMLALSVVAEELGRECGSTALVFAMHCVGSKVLTVTPTADQVDRYLRPIAAGEHVTSLALAEPGTGVHFYLPGMSFRREGDDFLVNGRKAFVTSGGHADSYVVNLVGEGAEIDPGTFSCMLIDGASTEGAWGAPWDGLGMRGNSSRELHLDDARIPTTNLLGAEGDETWFVFEVLAPYFIVAMAGTYLGIASAALDEAVGHLRKRTYDHTGQRVAAADTVAHRVGELWTRVERARQLLHHAARQGDTGHPDARKALFACKVEVAETAVGVVNDAMTLVGGIGFGRNGRLGRALRDARASHVMSPTTDLLKVWLGRSLLELPLL